MSEIDPVYVRPNRYVDSDHPEIVAYARRYDRGDPKASAVALFYAVRDGWRYNPYRIALEPEGYLASEVLSRPGDRGGHCIDKALLLAAAARALGIPSRLHFANVRNHVGTAKLEEYLGTDLLVFHGYTELFLEGRWVATTPAFNKELCERLGVSPLEWDGERDAIFQEYDRDTRFMEYVEDHGSHAEIPFDAMVAAWRRHYPKLAPQGVAALDGDLSAAG